MNQNDQKKARELKRRFKQGAQNLNPGNFNTSEYNLIGNVVANEIGKYNKKANRQIFQNHRMLNHDDVGYMVVLDIDVAPDYLWQRVWAVGTPWGLAAIILEVYLQPVKLAEFWGDKARIPEEGIISLASAPSIDEFMRRVQKSTPEDRYQHGDYRIMRALFRAFDFIKKEVRSTLKVKKLESGVIWIPEDRNQLNQLRKHFDPELDRIEERDSEEVILVGY